MSWVTPPSPASGGGAAETAQYLTLTLDATLTAERKFVPAEGLGATDGGANGNYSLAMNSRVLDQTGISLTTSVSTTLYSVSIPANTLGTNKGVRFTIFGTKSINNLLTLSARVVLGATTMHDDAIILPADAANSRAWCINYTLFAENATNAQTISGRFNHGDSLTGTTGTGNLGTDENAVSAAIFGTAAEDSTTDLTFAIIVNGAVANLIRRYAIARVI